MFEDKYTFKLTFIFKQLSFYFRFNYRSSFVPKMFSIQIINKIKILKETFITLSDHSNILLEPKSNLKSINRFITFTFSFKCKFNNDNPNGKNSNWLKTFNEENDQLFGPIINTHPKSELDEGRKKFEKNENIKIDTIVNLLPTLDDLDKFKSFPLFNPYKTNQTCETQLYTKRKQILAQNNLTLSQFPSVTKVLSSTMSQESIEALEKWRIKMIAELGEQGFLEMKAKLFRRGRLLHQNIAFLLNEQQDCLSIDAEIEGFWKSLSHLFSSFSQVKLLEKNVCHPFLCYKGIIDCVAHYNNELLLIDWKTSSRIKPNLSNLYDEPIQAAAYIGALNFDDNFDFQIDKLAIIIAYEDGHPAHVHKLSKSLCHSYWSLWTLRLKQYWETNKLINKKGSDKTNKIKKNEAI